MNFRSFDPTCRFSPSEFPKVRQIIDEIHHMRDEGYLVYDSDEYLEDMYRLVRGERVRWRDRNDGVCDSPNLYFAIQPNGYMAVCCDHRLDSVVSTMDSKFPDRFFEESLRQEAHNIAAACSGCLYGSFPEMTITSRYLKPMIKRALFFNGTKKELLKNYSYEEMLEIATKLRAANPELYIERINNP